MVLDAHITTTGLVHTATMVFGLIALSAMTPTMIGLNQATQNTRDGEEERREAARRQRCNLLATCDAREGTLEQRKQVHNAKVYLGPDGNVSPLFYLWRSYKLS